MVTKLIFELQPLKSKIRVVLKGYTVVMVTCVKKMTMICSPMIRHLSDIIVTVMCQLSVVVLIRQSSVL